MVRTVLRHAAAGLGFALACAAAAPAWAGPYYIDRFYGERNGAALFSDEFSDGFGPPTGGTFIGNSTSLYSVDRVVGNFNGAEQNGKLTLDPQGRGVQTLNPFTLQPEGVFFTAAYLNTNTDALPANAARGLKLDHTFAIHGLFDLVMPPSVALGESYGIRLADFDNRGADGWNDVLDLVIARSTSTGNVRLYLIRRDFHLQTRTFVSIVDPDWSLGDQIELTLFKDTAGDPTVKAGYRMVQGGAAASAFQVFGESDLFNGEIFTRAGFMAAGNARTSGVPAPSVPALLLAAGLAAYGLRRRRP